MTMKRNVTLVGVLGLVGGVVATVRAQEAVIASQADWGRNLISNSSFEDGFRKWALTLGARQEGDEIRSTLAIDMEVAHDGHSSLRLSGGEETTLWLSAKSSPVAVQEDRHYVLAAWIRADKVKRAMTQYLNCNAYAQFLDADGKTVLLGRSPVRATRKVTGTEDWTRVSVVVKAPSGAVAAEAGVALTCTGTAWFDEVTLFEAADVNWIRKESDRFIYFYEEGNEPPQKIIDGNNRFLTSLEQVLGLRHPGKISYYRYYSDERKAVLTGDSSRGHYRRGEVHALRWFDKNVLVGAIMSEVGESTPFLGNGIAAYTLSSLRGQSVHKTASAMAVGGSLQSSVKLQDPQAFTMFPGGLVQAMSASFVGYLVEQYGMDKFIRFYAFKSPEEAVEKVGERAQAVYGRTLEQLDREWHEFLKSL